MIRYATYRLQGAPRIAEADRLTPERARRPVEALSVRPASSDFRTAPLLRVLVGDDAMQALLIDLVETRGWDPESVDFQFALDGLLLQADFTYADVIRTRRSFGYLHGARTVIEAWLTELASVRAPAAA